MLAIDADEALGEDAVQRGDEVVSFDADVQEAAQHVDHVVGVDGGEDKVAGERGVDGDLGGLLVADFADHDLVGIVAQNGTQAAREGQAFLFVHRNLRDSLELIFDGIFDGDDFVFVVLDFAERGVEGGRFAGTGGAGDEHHPVGFGDIAAEFREIVFAEADHVEREFGELLAHRLLIEHAKHGVFAMDGGHDRDAEIDETAFVADAETAVLGDAALGDVELAHDFDARNDGGVPVLGDRRHGVVQDAVDAVLDDHFLIAGFDVDVAGAALEGVEDGGIDELDDRRDVAVDGGEAVDGEGFFGVILVSDDVERETFGDFFEDALRLLGFLEEIGDLGGGGDFDAEFFVQQQAQFVDRVEVARVGEGDFEGSVSGP